MAACSLVVAGCLDMLDPLDKAGAAIGGASLVPPGDVVQQPSPPGEARPLKFAKSSVAGLTPRQRAIAAHYFYGHSDMSR